DQILGLDRAHDFASIAVDEGSGRVYVAYQVNNGSGQGDIAVQVGTGSAFGPRLLVNSNPGADRAQFFPAVTVDPSTHRVHAVWYDQDAAAGGGDLTELMHTWSDDGGTTWS